MIKGVRLKSNWSAKSYPELLRRIRSRDPETARTVVLLTNNFFSPPEVIAQLYTKRWQIELFFKWIKQHLRLRAFYGRSANAVRCQVWSAICAYLLVAKTLNEILQITSVGIFELTPANIVFSDSWRANASRQNNSQAQKSFPGWGL